MNPEVQTLVAQVVGEAFYNFLSRTLRRQAIIRSAHLVPARAARKARDWVIRKSALESLTARQLTAARSAIPPAPGCTSSRAIGGRLGQAGRDRHFQACAAHQDHNTERPAGQDLSNNESRRSFLRWAPAWRQF